MTFNDFLSKLPDKDIWTHLSETKKPLVMYGMGNGADKICEVLDKRGLVISDYFASDEFVRGQSFHGKKVLKYGDIKAKYDEFIILVSFGTKLDSVIERIQELAKENELYLPDVPVAGTDLFDYSFFKQNIDRIKSAFEILGDETSKEILYDIISYKLSGKIEYLLRQTENTSESIKTLLHFKKWETFLDLGAYNGDTVKETLLLAPNLSKIIAFEPDIKNFKKLENYFSELTIDAKAYNLCAWDKHEELIFESSGNRNSTVSTLNHTASIGDTKKITILADSVDNILSGERVDYINFDVEGAESKAIQGSKATLQKWSPDLLVAAYHRSGDSFDLINELSDILPEHNFFLRRKKCLPAWELNIYGAKK